MIFRKNEMVSLLQKLLFIVFVLLTLICFFKNSYAESSLAKLSLDERDQYFKEKRENINSIIKFIEKKIDEFNILKNRISNNTEHYRLLQEQNKLLQEQKDLKDEYYNIGYKLNNLTEKKLKFIAKIHVAREYEVKEYEENL